MTTHPNPMVESLKSSENFYSSSQVNPNSSSTNLSKLVGQRGLPSFHSPKPNKRISLSSNQHFSSFQLPLTPPVSNASTPVEENRFSYDSPAFSSSTLGLPPYLARYLPPIDFKITALCALWYLVSIVSNNSTKMILSQYKHPVTLTQCQFMLNSLFSVILLSAVSCYSEIRSYFPKGVLPAIPSGNASPARHIALFLTPTALIISTTLPMGCFQFIGHLTSHKATSLIPVSLVHTIKALSPLMTVLIYRFLYRRKYKTITYVTLTPLIVGIMLTCYKPKKNSSSESGSSYVIGLGYACISMMIFVSQNIFAKKRLTIEKNDKVNVLPTSSKIDNSDKKLDKLTILFYCSVIGFIFTSPIYLVAEYRSKTISLFELNLPVICLIILNGLSHFLQSLLAFQILGAMSPINYSIANILKRIIIIVIAFIWENKNFTNVQAAGLCLTILGLYCYDRWGTTQEPKHT